MEIANLIAVAFAVCVVEGPWPSWMLVTRGSDNELPEVAIYLPAPSGPQALRAGVTKVELRGLELSEKQRLQGPR